MFFRMLRNDLKAKKGLNVILFIFLIASAALVFAGAVQIYSALNGKEYTADMCKMSDIYLYVSEGNHDKAKSILDASENVLDYYESDARMLISSQLDFECFEETEDDHFDASGHYLVRQPRKTDLVYDEFGHPFYVKSGTMYVPLRMKDLAGACIGDTVKLTTHMGNTYSFTIAGFYKEGFDYRNRYIISDSDYEILNKEYPIGLSVFELNLKNKDELSRNKLYSDLRSEGVGLTAFRRLDMTTDATLTFILAAFIAVVSIFMILIIFMTIRFTMISAIRDEEKEIGTMRAIGTDSISFRWLFAAKYIAFAVLGGILGVIVGFILSNQFLNIFSANLLFPPVGVQLVIGTIAVLVMVCLIILFCFFVMRKIKKISVIDAIRGGEGGERFGNISLLFLHKRKAMRVPWYLAISDILKNFKRYIFLVAGYMLGCMIILLVFYVASSVVSKEFMRYYGLNQIDFYPDFHSELMYEYGERCYTEGKEFYDLINEDFQQNDIPAHIVTFDEMTGYMLYGNEQVEYTVWFECGEPDKYLYCEGSRVPVLANEVALSEYSAKLYGIKIGDIITMELPETDDGGITVTRNQRELVVTGFLNYSEFSYRAALMGSEYHAGARDFHGFSSIIIDEGGQDTFKRIEDLYGETNVMSAQEYLEHSLMDYIGLFNMLKIVMTATVIFITVLMTVLYVNIFRYEDRSEIALLNTLGFGNGSVAAWQILRMLILVLISIVLGTILVNTLGQLLVGVLFNYVKLKGFRFIVNWFTTLVIMPAIIIGSALIPTVLKLKDLRKTKLADIAEE